MKKAFYLCSIKANDMTLQDLKDNREQIIAYIIENYGAESVSEIMNAMVKWLGYKGICSTDVLEYIDEVMELAEICKPKMIYTGASEWLAAKNRENAMNNLPSSMRRY